MRARIWFPFVVALWALLSIDPPAAQSPPAPRLRSGQADPMAEGAAVFQRVCSSCHGDAGAGGRASSLIDNRRLRARSRAEIETIIRNGMPNGMPPFGSLPEADLQAVTTFVRSFNSSAFDLQPAETSPPARRSSLEKGSARRVTSRVAKVPRAGRICRISAGK